MEKKESFCLFCSLGCKFAVEVDAGRAIRPDFCPDYPVNRGNLCPRGLYSIELLDHYQRLVSPLIRDGGKFEEASWKDSIHLLASRINEIKTRYGSQSIGIIIDPNHTNEEILAVQELAKIIGTDNFACSFPPNDKELLCASNITPNGNIEDLEDVNCCLIIGNLFATHPVLAKRVIANKYSARGNSIIVIDPERTNTAWYASTHLQNKPGSEAVLLMGILKSFFSHYPEKGKGISEKLQAIPDEIISQATGISKAQITMTSRAFNNAEKGIVILCPGLKGISNINILAQLIKLLTDNCKGNKRCMPLFSFGNAVGAFKMSQKGTWKSFPRIIEEMSSGGIRLLIDFGESLLSSSPSADVKKGLEQLEFFAVSSLFAAETENLAHLVFPRASWLEKSGTVNFFDGREEHLEPILMPAGAARPDLEIISELSRELGTPLDENELRQEADSSNGENLSEGEDKLDLDRLAESFDEIVKETAIEDEEYPYHLISGNATGHFTDGAITRNIEWAREMFPSLFIELSSEDAQDMEISNGDEVLVSSRNGEILLPARVTDRLCKGVACAPSYSPEIRSIFGWQTTPEGEFQTAPERVRISRKQE